MVPGDWHVHSERSHAGELTPGELVAAARAAGLDFIAITEHNIAAVPGDWAPYGKELLIVPGQEVVTASGHWLALGLEPGQVVDSVAQVHAVGGLCVVAHPHAPYPSGTFEYSFDGFDAVEVWNGQWASDRPWNADNEAALADWGRAVHRTALGNSDVHLRGQIGTPQTVVLAEELTAAALLAGVRAGRCWIAESASVGLSVTAHAGDRTAGIGELLATGGAPVAVNVQVSGVPEARITVHFGGRREFVWAEVRHADGRMAALTNPIRLS